MFRGAAGAKFLIVYIIYLVSSPSGDRVGQLPRGSPPPGGTTIHYFRNVSSRCGKGRKGPYNISFNLKLLFAIQKQIQLLQELERASLIRNQDCQSGVEQVIKDKEK